MPFDIQQAIADGEPKEDIAKYLADQNNIDLERVLNEEDDTIDEVLNHLIKLDATTTQIEQNTRPEEPINPDLGVPLGTRQAMGSGRSPQDQLATLQAHGYKDAELRGKSLVLGRDEDKFVYTDPATGQKAYANPKGFDLGDVVQHGDTAAEMAGYPIGFAAEKALSPASSGKTGAAAGAAATKYAYGLLQEFMNGRVDSRDVWKRIGDMANDTSLNLVGDEVAEKALDVGKRGIQKVFGGGRNKLASADTQQLLDDYKILGLPPDAGAITGNSGTQRLQEGLHKSLTSSKVMQEHSNAINEGLGDALKETAKGFRGQIMTTQGAGEVIKKGASRAIKKYSKVFNRLERRADNLIGTDAPTPLDDTVNSFEKIFTKTEGTPNLDKRLNSTLKDMFKDIQADMVDGAIPYQALRALRTKVGSMKNGISGTALGDVQQGQLKKIYEGMTKDLRYVAESSGDDALKAFDKAMTYEKGIYAEHLPLLKQIEKHQYDDKTFKTIMNTAKDGGTKLRILRQNLKPSEWNDVASSTLYHMGMAVNSKQNVAGDAFSAGTFLTNWNKLKPEAKRQLFGGKRYNESLRQNLDRFVRVVGSQKDIEKVINYSNTAGTNEAIDLVKHTGRALLLPLFGAGLGAGVEGSAGAVAGLGAATITPYVTAKLMTNPKFIRWLTSTTKKAVNPKKSFTHHLGEATRATPKNVASALTRLSNSVSGDMKEEVDQYIRQVNSLMDLDGKRIKVNKK